MTTKREVAQLYVRDSFSFMELKQTTSPRGSKDPIDPFLSVDGSLAVVDSATGTQVQYVVTVKAGFIGLPPVVSTPTYNNPGATTSFNVSLAGLAVEGCVIGVEPPTPAACSPMTLDMTWVARGVRNVEFMEETTTKRTDYNFNPPSKSDTKAFTKFEFDQYVSTNPVSLRLTKADTQALVYNAPISCQDQNGCQFLVGEQPDRYFSRA
jgi:hypothetical protein